MFGLPLKGFFQLFECSYITLSLLFLFIPCFEFHFIEVIQMTPRESCISQMIRKSSLLVSLPDYILYLFQNLKKKIMEMQQEFRSAPYKAQILFLGSLCRTWKQFENLSNSSQGSSRMINLENAEKSKWGV